jgi:hypothetical protein
MRPGVGPALLALGPGLAMSGIGTWTAGDRDLGRTLLTAQMAGIGIAAAGGIPLLVTGASRRVSGLSMAFILAGGGMFLGSWMADIYAAATGGSDRPLWRDRPGLELSGGYAYVYDPLFAYRNFAVVDLDLRQGPWRVTPSAWLAVDDSAQRARLELARRWTADDRSFLEWVGALTWHHLGDAEVAVWTAETFMSARVNMARLGAPLRGSFFALGLGLGLESYRVRGATDLLDLPLARAGYGVALARGEVELYYEHRHDDFSGGLGTGQQFDGPYGHVGARLMTYLSQTWGLEAELEAGSAYVGSVRALWRTR